MHELTICHHILTLLEAQAERKHFQRIKTVWLEVGDLVGIEIDALKFSFPIAAKRTVAEGATLEVVQIPGEGFCQHCRISVVIETFFSPCSQCHRYQYEIIKGKELRVIKMEVD